MGIEFAPCTYAGLTIGGIHDLTDSAAKSAKPHKKQYKLYDSGGLYLLIHPNGSKYWRLTYRHVNKEKTLALGVYPDASLATAREARDEAKRTLKQCKTPPMPAATPTYDRPQFH